MSAAATRENVRRLKADEAARGPVERKKGVERNKTKARGCTGRSWKLESAQIIFWDAHRTLK